MSKWLYRLVAWGIAAIAVAGYLPPGGSGSAEADEPPPQPTRELAFSPDGKWLAGAFGEINQPGSLIVWDIELGRPILVHTEDGGIANVDFSPNGKLLAIGMFGPAAKLLSPQTGEVVREFRGHSHHARSVAFVTDTVLATGSYDRSVRLWNVETAEPIATLGEHDHEVREIAASPDGQWLVSGARSPDVRLWNIEEQREVAIFRPSDLIAPMVAFSRDGRYFLTGRWDAQVRIRETQTHALRASIHTHNRGFDLSPNNRTLIVCDDEPWMNVFQVALEAPDEKVRQRIEALIGAWHSEDYDKREAASRELIEIGMAAESLLREAVHAESAEVRIRARRVRAAVLSPEPQRIDVGHKAGVGAVRFSPDGRLVASGDTGGVVKVWSAESRKPVLSLGPVR